jgi:hypothetical protein
MSEKQHTKDEEKLEGRHKQVGGSDNGACLNRHVSKFERKNSCSHRWQAYQRAQEDKRLYNWPRYEPLARRGGSLRTAVGRDKKGNLFPPWYQESLDAPRELRDKNEAGTWDLDYADNFRVKCYRPYWHEANHVIPNGSLQKAIAEVGKGMNNPAMITQVIRGRLLNAQYNLNHKVNMILLPMDEEVAQALRLPRHRQTAFLRSHRAYSMNVEGRLGEIFRPVQKAIRQHEVPKYRDCKKELEDLSTELYDAIVKAGERGVGSLDEMPREDFEPNSRPTQPARPTRRPGT